MRNDLAIIWKHSRSLVGKLYFDWIEKQGLVDLFLRPETIPSIFFQKKWSNGNQKFLEEILEFMESLNLLRGAGGTFVMSDTYSQEISKLNDNLQENYDKSIIYTFVNYGLKLLESKLEGDVGEWDIDKHKYLFERGITFKLAHNLFHIILEDYVKDIKLKLKKPKILIYSHYISGFIEPLIEKYDQFSKIKIITPDETSKDHAITAVELNTSTAFLSDTIYSLKEIRSKELERYDVIIIPNGIGFNVTLKEHLSFIEKSITKNGHLYLIIPSDNSTRIGIEPLFHLHPNYKLIPSSEEFIKQLQILEFTDVKKIGFEGLILKANYQLS